MLYIAAMRLMTTMGRSSGSPTDGVDPSLRRRWRGFMVVMSRASAGQRMSAATLREVEMFELREQSAKLPGDAGSPLTARDAFRPAHLRGAAEPRYFLSINA